MSKPIPEPKPAKRSPGRKPSDQPTSHKHVAIYVRVSGKRQDTASQEADLKSWAGRQDFPVTWYRDKFTGKSMDRPGMTKLLSNLRAGRVSAVVV